MKFATVATLIGTTQALAVNFRVLNGGKGVHVDKEGCITDGEGDYSKNEAARIKVLADGMLDVSHFHTEDEGGLIGNKWVGQRYWRDLGVFGNDRGNMKNSKNFKAGYLTKAEAYGGGGGKSSAHTRSDGSDSYANHRQSAYWSTSASKATGSWSGEHSISNRGISMSKMYETIAPGGDNTVYDRYWYYVDYLEVTDEDGMKRKYHGPDSPHGVRVKKGTIMKWKTDSAHHAEGFQICLDTNPGPKPAPSFKVKNHAKNGIELTAAGCFTDGIGFYRSGERSTITVLEDGILEAKHFSVEKKHDNLVINGVSYSGEKNTPSGVHVSKGDKITWKSDMQMVRSGFIVCLNQIDDPIYCGDWSCDDWCEYFVDGRDYGECESDDDVPTCKC
jgi:hypothetical protein